MIAIRAKEINWASIKETKIKYLLKKPAKGGIPAIESKDKAKEIANIGLDLDKPLNWVM